jgi:acyl carrier protein
LGEIESALQQHAGVRQGVVLAKEDHIGNKRLVGYVAPEGIFNKEAITAYLKDQLPEYMVPALWVELDSLPVTVNGKIDRKALPDPDASKLLSNNYVAPRNEIEEKLAAIWQQLLGVEKVGVYDNFFELGGHSLLAIRVISAIRKELNVELAIKDLFHFTTINDLSKYVEIQTIYSGEKAFAEFELLNI